jgi:hypothetical protein
MSAKLRKSPLNPAYKNSPFAGLANKRIRVSRVPFSHISQTLFNGIFQLAHQPAKIRRVAHFFNARAG